MTGRASRFRRQRVTGSASNEGFPEICGLDQFLTLSGRCLASSDSTLSERYTFSNDWYGTSRLLASSFSSASIASGRLRDEPWTNPGTRRNRARPGTKYRRSAPECFASVPQYRCDCVGQVLFAVSILLPLPWLRLTEADWREQVRETDIDSQIDMDSHSQRINRPTRRPIGYISPRKGVVFRARGTRGTEQRCSRISGLRHRRPLAHSERQFLIVFARCFANSDSIRSERYTFTSD